jgi:phosphoribosylaminoimidazole-succinocarboxamide synthase
MTEQTASIVYRTQLPLPDRRQGKVRDIYSVPGGDEPQLLIVATDRISAFDVVLPTAIPGKGAMLTDIATRWFDFVRKLDLVGDHLISGDPADVPNLDKAHHRDLVGRIMLGRQTQVIPIECVVRGYLAGSGWVEYGQSGTVCGIPLPAGLERCGRLPELIFTPATKATEGHDENIDFDQSCQIAGRAVMEKLREVSLRIYSEAAAYALERGIILADTKFEFGYALDNQGQPTDEILLIDEVLTPDSSRFWPAEKYEPGREQESFDKQYVRNHLLTLVEEGEWDKTPPGPELPTTVVSNTIARYEQAKDRLFGSGS